MGREGNITAPASAPVPASLSLPFHCESARDVHALADALFSYLDDHERLAEHMSKSSWMMLGSRMTIALDAAKGRAIGSHITLMGTILGVPLSVDEVVIERQPPLRKVWQTVGVPRLLIIGHYRMGFEIRPHSSSASLRVFIDYASPTTWLGRWLGRLFGGFYARWCTESMVRDAANHFPL